MGEAHNIFWRLFVGRRLGRLEGLAIPDDSDRQGQLLFGAANFLGLLIILMLLGTLPALYSPTALVLVLMIIALAVFLRGAIAVAYYRHIKNWRGLAFYAASLAILAVVIGVLLII